MTLAGTRERYMLQRLGIRGKLLAVVAVPTIVLLLAASFVVFNAVVDQSSARNTEQLVTLVQDGASMVEDVQAERSNVSNYLRAVADGEAKTVTASASVNTTVAAITKAAAEDPSYAAAANAIAAAVQGAGGEDGLDTYRQITTVRLVGGAFPAWPDTDQVAAARDGFDRIADEVDAAVVGAPVSDTGTVMRGLGGLIRTEGLAVSTYLNDAKRFSDQLPGDMVSLDKSASVFLASADSVGSGSVNAGVLDLVTDARTRLADIDVVRGGVRRGTIIPGNAENAYTAVANDILEMTRSVADSATNRQLATYLTAYASMNELFEAMNLEQDYVARKIREGYWVFGETSGFQGLYFGSNSALANAKLAVDPLPDIPSVPSFGASYGLAERNGYETIRDRLLADPTNQALLDQRNADWEQQVGEELAVMAPIRADILGQVRQGASDLVRNSLVQLLATIAVAVIVFTMSLVVTLSMARRIINPLRRLTTTATAVRQELPRLVERVALPGQSVDVSEVQIPVESQDEVGRLAEAFNSVNAATLSIASEQAALRGSISEMFVNVARRDQVLLNRQLSSIDEMERAEDNQTTLTKLFALDHLATRMRRNSESLLVLAGIDTGRRLRRSMPLSDVIRTASSEIELYERVQLELDADPSMLGHSALTAAHMFAELLENATVFSDPGTPVVVRTMTEGDDICVEVVDYGIGMTPEELGEANARVASTAASEILGAQRLGLFVVGRIARRVGARVLLESIEGGGICARVVMPPSLFDATAPYDQGHLSSTAVDESAHAPAALVHHSVSDAEVRDPVPTEAQRPLAPLHGYQPTIIEGGADLAGRTAEPPVTAEVAGVLPDGASSGIESLVASDAASAPEAVPVDLDALTDGATATGLPKRRRKRGDAGSEAPQETHSIMALPMRASDAQLTALESAMTSGFTPILAADEVSPESAEQRARVFRGFRSLRSDDDEPELLSPDAESLGHAVRRGAPVTDHLGESTKPAPIPSLELEAEEPAVSREASGASDRDVAQEPESPFAVEATDPRHSESPITRQSPLIATGFTGEDADSGPGAGPTPSMAIPMLEEDEPEPQQVQASPWSQPGEPQSAGVDSVALDDNPYSRSPESQPHGRNGESEAPAAQAEPAVRSPLYPMAPRAEEPAAQGPFGDSVGDWRQGSQDQSPQFESDPVTSTPSLDELISDGSRSESAEERGGFFSRVFGRGHKEEAPPEADTSEPSDAFAPDAGAPAFPAPLGGPADVLPVPPATWQGPVPSTTLYEDQGPSPAEPQSGDLSAPAPEAPRQREDRSMWIGQAPSAALNEPESVAPQSVPQERQSEFTPDLTPNESTDADWSPLGRAVAPDSADSHAVFGPGGVPAVYSPDQLARPLGWEAAGESALQAAAPEAATEYRPVVQVEPQQQGEGSVDFTSEVFSELSSLAAERPKVEKTRAGLVKRTPVEREADSEGGADVAEPEVPRDAEAIRHRFSSFYSGTQRARDDVKNFNDSTQGSLTEP